MTSDRPYTLPNRNRRDAKDRAQGQAPLDGEVIPPTIKVVNEKAPLPPTPAPSYRLRLSTALMASCLGLCLIGGGAFETYRWTQLQARAATPDATVLALGRMQDDLGKLKASVESGRQDETVKALKKSVDVLRAELDGVRTANTAALAQVSAKLDKPVQAQGPSTADVMARIDKLDHDPRLGDIASRLDRIEHQVSAPMPTGSVSAPAHSPVVQTIVAQGNTGPAITKPLPKPAVLDNWIVRDVYSGVALVEGRGGGVREVVPGETLPGAGEVRSIERRGRAWIVVTSRGIIDTETW